MRSYEQQLKWLKLVSRLVERNVRTEQVGLWADKLLEDDEKAVQLHKAGVNYYGLLEALEKVEVPIEEVLSARKKLIDEGFTPYEAEITLALHLTYLKNWKEGIRHAIYLRQEGALTLDLIYLFDKRNLTLEQVKELVKVLESEGFNTKASLGELYHILRVHPHRPLNEETLKEILQEAKELGFKTPYLARYITYAEGTKPTGYAYQPSRLLEAKEKLDYYLSIGLESIEAEWWAKEEAINGVRPAKYEIERWKKVIGKFNAVGLNRAFYLMKKFSHLSHEELIDLYKLPLSLESINQWKEKGFSPEQIDKWTALQVSVERAVQLEKAGITPDEYYKILIRTGINTRKLQEWLPYVDIDEVEKWVRWGIDNKEVYQILKKKNLSIDRLIREAQERKLRFTKDIFEYIREIITKEMQASIKKKAFTTALGLFKKKKP